MKLVKKVVGLSLALALCSINISAFAQSPNENFNNENSVTFLQGDTSDHQARMADYFTIDLTDNNWKEVGIDNNLLNATARVKVALFSDNITSVDVKLEDKRGTQTVISTGLKEGEWSKPINVQFLMGYRLKIKANSSKKLSQTNVGTVTVYWSDQGDWS